jgi:hypothetical protein
VNPDAAATFDELDDAIRSLTFWHRRDLATMFDYLRAVVEARFARIDAGLQMTREVIGNG